MMHLPQAICPIDVVFQAPHLAIRYPLKFCILYIRKKRLFFHPIKTAQWSSGMILALGLISSSDQEDVRGLRFNPGLSPFFLIFLALFLHPRLALILRFESFFGSETWTFCLRVLPLL
jgi:hypothetical protein